MATSNLHKAAIVLLSLPKKQVAELLSRLEPQQAEAVSEKMNELRDISADEQETAVREFTESGFAGRGKRPAVEPSPFHFLDELPGEDLFDAVADEQPQTIALILSHLSPRQAADLLAQLAPDQQLAVICRMAIMGDVEPAVVRDVEAALKRSLAGGVVHPAGSRGVAGVVRMLNVMDPAAERNLFDRLAKADPELVREIRRVMFGADVADAEQWSVVEAAG